MTPSQQQMAAELLTASLDARLLAAETYVKLCEFTVPLVDGDREIILEARRIQGEVEHFANSAKANLPDATAKNWRETFREFRGE